MKVYAAGALLRGDAKSRPVASTEAMGYVLSLPGVSTVVIGCSTQAEVDENAQIARAFQSYDAPTMRAIEGRTMARASVYTSYKKMA
jgi:predicted aldo/keto reductase-like oxidoreductase